MTYFFRYITEKIKNRFENNQIIILVGARQVGKTNIIKNYFANYLSARTKRCYFDFERLEDLEAWQSLEYLEKYLSQQNLSLHEDIFLGIDEFQYLKNATKFFKLIFDNYPKVKILATGSSSLEIQKHLKESLAGRKKVYFVYPLSFEEYILTFDKKDEWKKINYRSVLPRQVEKMNTSFLEDYLLWGAYPRLADKRSIGNEERREELADIYSSYIQKDIKSLISGENIMAFNSLLKALAAQIGNLLNIDELSRLVNLSRYDIEKYLTILEETFIIKRVAPFFKNKRKEITKMSKLYFSDSGLTNMIVGNFSELSARSNIGAILENYVYNQLRHFVELGDNIYFWRMIEGGELDFVWQRGDNILPVEVKWAKFNSDNIPVSLLNFCEKYAPIKEAWIVTKDFSAEREKNGTKFIFIPAVLLIKKLKEK